MGRECKGPGESRRASGPGAGGACLEMGGETGRQEAQGQVLRALESHSEESRSGQPSGTLLRRGASFLSWEAISPRREAWSVQAQPTGRQLQERWLQRRATRWLREKTAQRRLLPLLTPFLSKVEKHFFPPSKSFLSKQSLCLFFFFFFKQKERIATSTIAWSG